MLYEKILEYREELFDDLNRLLSIESVDGARDGDCAAALDFILKRAEDFGLTAERVTAKSAHVDLGKGGRLCGVLSHLDVVPAGNNWTVNPYALTERDGRLYGRGVADDKGAALVNLYCLRALKEMGIEGRNTLRAIYGTAEETGMSDMDGYFAQKRLPDLAFTPDSEYGVCYAEKGILQLEVSTPTNEAKVLSQFHAGKAINAVPDLAYVMLDSSGYDEQLLMRLADASEGNFEFNYTIDGLMIISRGKAAHACEPQKGFNAAAALIDLITHAYDVYEIGALSSFIDSTSRAPRRARSSTSAIPSRSTATMCCGSSAPSRRTTTSPSGCCTMTDRSTSKRTASWCACLPTRTGPSRVRTRRSIPRAAAPTPASWAERALPSAPISGTTTSACTTPTRALTKKTSSDICKSALRRFTDFIHWSKL